MSDNELKRKLLSSSLFTLLAFFLLMGISFAWFSKNTEVRAEGMGVELSTSANLVISQNMDFSGFLTEITMPSNTVKLLPAIHSGFSQTNTTGLRRPTDLSGVGFQTGLSPGTDIALADVPSEKSSQYYIDYTVYISCQGKALENATLTAAVTATTDQPYHQAATVDFYLSEVSQGNYKGSLNLAGLDMEKNHGKHDASAVKTELNLLSDSRIPCTEDAEDSYLKIIMRCYFDGALQNTDNTTYVTSAAINTERFYLDISFTADGTEADPQ